MNDEQLPKKITQKELVPQVLDRVLFGNTDTDIAKEFGVSRKQIYRIRQLPQFKKLLEEKADTAVSEARELIKRKADILAPMAYDALRHNLKENKMEAVRVVFEFIGLNNKLDGPKQEAVINVLLPAGTELTKEVKADIVVNEEDKECTS